MKNSLIYHVGHKRSPARSTQAKENTVKIEKFHQNEISMGLHHFTFRENLKRSKQLSKHFRIEKKIIERRKKEFRMLLTFLWYIKKLDNL